MVKNNLVESSIQQKESLVEDSMKISHINPLALITTDDAATAFSGQVCQVSESVATIGTTSKAKRKLRAYPAQKATTRSTGFNVAIQEAD